MSRVRFDGSGTAAPISAARQQLPREESPLSLRRPLRLLARRGLDLLRGDDAVVIEVRLVEGGNLGRPELVRTDLPVVIRVELLQDLRRRRVGLDRGDGRELIEAQLS